MSQLAINYRDFYDVPRAFVVRYQGTIFFFDCPFDATRDAYPEQYAVYRLPADTTPSQLDESWEGLAVLGELVGRAAIRDVKFDPSKREWIDDSVITGL